MRLLLLSRARGLYSTRRLGLCGLARGHDVRLVSPWACALSLGDGPSRVEAEGLPEGTADAVIFRGGPGASGHGVSVLRHFELAGAFCLNGSEATLRARDKALATQLLAHAGVPVVPTVLARRPSAVRAAVEQLGGPPVVIKFNEGTQGTGVMLLESAASAESVVGALFAVHRQLLIQRYVPHRSDARLFVVGGQVVAAMRRVAAPGDFRANLHRGALAEPWNPPAEAREIAVRAAATLGLGCAGVDLIEAADGPAVLEVNASPGLEGIEAASGRNVALAILRHVEDAVARTCAVALP